MAAARGEPPSDPAAGGRWPRPALPIASERRTGARTGGIRRRRARGASLWPKGNEMEYGSSQKGGGGPQSGVFPPLKSCVAAYLARTSAPEVHVRKIAHLQRAKQWDARLASKIGGQRKKRARRRGRVDRRQRLARALNPQQNFYIIRYVFYCT